MCSGPERTESHLRGIISVGGNCRGRQNEESARSWWIDGVHDLHRQVDRIDFVLAT